MPALDIFLYWNHGLYGDAGMACYYTLAACYGLFVWKFVKTRKKKEPLPITHMPLSKYLPTTLFFFAAWGLLFPYSTPSPMPCRLSACGRWLANISSSGSSGLSSISSVPSFIYKKVFPSRLVSMDSMSLLL